MLIVTLGIDEVSFKTLDQHRKEYFPRERNFIPAHISLFHALPVEHFETVANELQRVAAETSPLEIKFTSITQMSGGFAVRVEAPGLDSLHRLLRSRFESWLSPQDQQPFRPHVTLMNKAPAKEARRQQALFEERWSVQAGMATELLLWTYLGGPWRKEKVFSFQGT